MNDYLELKIKGIVNFCIKSIFEKYNIFFYPNNKENIYMHNMHTIYVFNLFDLHIKVPI